MSVRIKIGGRWVDWPEEVPIVGQSFYAEPGDDLLVEDSVGATAACDTRLKAPQTEG